MKYMFFIGVFLRIMVKVLFWNVYDEWFFIEIKLMINYGCVCNIEEWKKKIWMFKFNVFVCNVFFGGGSFNYFFSIMLLFIFYVVNYLCN